MSTRFALSILLSGAPSLLVQREVLRIARQFCGYFAILHNLHTTSISNISLDELINKLAGLELIYSVVYQMTTLHTDLASRIQAISSSADRGQPYHIALYALEIVYRGMTSYGIIDWDLPKHHVLFTLVSIAPGSQLAVC